MAIAPLVPSGDACPVAMATCRYGGWYFLISAYTYKMKKLIILLILTGSFAFSQAQFTKVTIQASGLTCAMCSRAIDDALRQLPFVASVKPDIRNSAFTVVFKENETADIDALKKAVEDAGFSVAKFTLTGTFINTSVRNDEHININGREYHFLNIKDQVLSGEKNLVIVDKDFLTAAAFKKYSAATSMQCIKSGRAASCCEKAGLAAGTRIYHVTI